MVVHTAHLPPMGLQIYPLTMLTISGPVKRIRNLSGTFTERHHRRSSNSEANLASFQR